MFSCTKFPRLSRFGSSVRPCLRCLLAGPAERLTNGISASVVSNIPDGADLLGPLFIEVVATFCDEVTEVVETRGEEVTGKEVSRKDAMRLLALLSCFSNSVSTALFFLTTLDTLLLVESLLWEVEARLDTSALISTLGSVK